MGHLGDVEEVLEGVRLIYDQAVHPEFLKGEGVVLAFIGQEVLELPL